jgi:hypothetical protein
MLSYPRRTGQRRCYPPTAITKYFSLLARVPDQINSKKANQEMASSPSGRCRGRRKTAYSMQVPEVGREIGPFKLLPEHMLSLLFWR